MPSRRQAGLAHGGMSRTVLALWKFKFWRDMFLKLKVTVVVRLLQVVFDGGGRRTLRIALCTLVALTAGCTARDDLTDFPVLTACARPSLIIGEDVPEDLRNKIHLHVSAIHNPKRFATVRASIRTELASLEHPLFIPPSFPPTSDAEKIVIANDQACAVSGRREHWEIVWTETVFKYERGTSVAPELIRDCLRAALLCE